MTKYNHIKFKLLERCMHTTKSKTSDHSLSCAETRVSLSCADTLVSPEDDLYPDEESVDTVVIGEGVNRFYIPFKICCPFTDILTYFFSCCLR